jgi:hypothetical protein
MHRSAARVFLLVCASAATFSGCTASDPAAPPMATPTVTLSRQKVVLGTPVEMTYKFVVANDAKFTTNYHVMVHFGDHDEQLLYTDDHDPPKPTSQWKPGETIEYTRTFFTPVYPYVGPATVEVGMFALGEKLRVPMAGTDTGHRSYQVATFTIAPQTEGIQLIYNEGFHGVEGAAANGVGWHWTKHDSAFAVKNPKKDAIFYLEVDNPSGTFNEPQQVTVSLAGVTIDQFTVMPHTGNSVLRKTAIPAASWGDGDNVELKIAVDKTFVPEQLSSSSKDSRELGIRVLHAAIVPQSEK